jgi:hypothetical protein
MLLDQNNIPNTDLDPGQQNQCGSIRIWIHNIVKVLGNFLKMSAREPQERSMEADGLVSSSMLLKSLVAGGLASMCGKTAVAPLDRIKILFQVHSILFCSVQALDSSHVRVFKLCFKLHMLNFC